MGWEDLDSGIIQIRWALRRESIAVGPKFFHMEQLPFGLMCCRSSETQKKLRSGIAHQAQHCATRCPHKAAWLALHTQPASSTVWGGAHWGSWSINGGHRSAGHLQLHAEIYQKSLLSPVHSSHPSTSLFTTSFAAQPSWRFFTRVRWKGHHGSRTAELPCLVFWAGSISKCTVSHWFLMGCCTCWKSECFMQIPISLEVFSGSLPRRTQTTVALLAMNCHLLMLSYKNYCLNKLPLTFSY